MAKYIYKVEEITRDGHIGHDAIEQQPSTGERIKIDNNKVTRAYPDIAEHLHRQHGVNITLTYNTRLNDSFYQGNYTWTFIRGQHTVVVIDRPRTIERVTITL